MADEMDVTPPHDKFHRELTDLKTSLLELARLARDAIQHSVTAFATADAELARQVIRGDAAVNSLEETIDAECVRIIALYQPVAIDLRQVMAVDHIIAELERIGDQATNIAEETMALEQTPPRPFHPELPQMAKDVQKMLRQSLQAFLTQDTALARQICKDDTLVDDLDQTITQELLRDMATRRKGVSSGQSQINVVRNLERVGDHATNIAEQVVYMVEGESVRHRCQG